MTNDQKLRRGILWMTVKVPVRQLSPSDEEMLRVKRLRQTFAGGY